MAGAGIMQKIIGPLPLRQRWTLFAAASVISGAAFLLHGLLNGFDARGGPWEALAGLAAFVALYLLMFRLVHPAAMRWLLRRTPRGSTRRLSAFSRWYLGDGSSDTPSSGS